MGSITRTKRTDKATGKAVTVYRAYVRRTGFASKSKVFTSISDAKDWLRNNESDATLVRAAGGQSLAAVIEAFVLAPPAKGRKYWAPSHLDFWRQQLGAMRTGDISRGDINAAKIKLQGKVAMRSTPGGAIESSSGAKLSDASVNRYLASLSSVLNYALEMGIIDEHPMKGGKVKKLSETNRRRRILTEAEEAALLDAASRSTWPMLRLFVRMCFTTAARRSEVLNLRWSDIDFAESVALVDKTKNGDSRALPLVSDVREDLQQAKTVRPLKSDFVFFNPRDPSRPMNPDTVWKKCRMDAGLWADRDDPLDRVVLHSTRHTAVTKMLRGDANAAQVANVSGHKTLSMLKRYSHLAASEAVDLAERTLK